MDRMIRGTTVLCVRREGRVVMAGDGQVTLDKTVMKSGARKVRRLGDGKVLAGFAGATADAFTLFELFEKKLKEHGRSLPRAAVELAKQWRRTCGWTWRGSPAAVTHRSRRRATDRGVRRPPR